jgi:hypothetical protein
LIRTAITAGASRGCLSGPFRLHAVANTPAGLMELIRSYRPINVGLPSTHGGSAPALNVSGPAQRSLRLLRPTCSPSRLMRPPTPEASAALLSPPPLRLLPGGTNQFPGGTFTRSGPARFHGAHENGSSVTQFRYASCRRAGHQWTRHQVRSLLRWHRGSLTCSESMDQRNATR